MEKQEFRALVFDAIVLATDENTANEKAGLAADLREEMLTRVVEFNFIKKDGSTRHAYGTICPDMLPPAPEQDTDKPKRAPNYANFCYYDTEKESWRSFNVVNLIGFEKGGKK